MIIIIIIITILLLFVSLVLFVKYKLFVNYVIWFFKNVNVHVWGSKRSGKDILFQWVINKISKPYYANIPYGNEYKLINVNELNLDPNNQFDLVNGEIIKTKHRFFEGSNVYLSDVGNFLPNILDSQLYRKYPSMPMFYSLSGQTYDMRVHTNSQGFERPWKALREQADFYIRTIRTFKLPFYLLTKVRTYEKYESAKSNLLPIKSRFLNKYSKATVDLYNSTNGMIKEGYILIKKSKIYYDTRFFEKLFLKGKRKEKL